MSELTHDKLDRGRRIALIVAAVALVLLIIGAFFSIDVFFQAYLVGYLYWLGIALGSGAIAMVHQLTGGRWGTAISGVLESSVRTLLLLAVLFVPLLFGLGRLYEWIGHPEELGDKAAYLNVPFFLVRALFYFAVWVVGGMLLVRWAVRYRATGEPVLVDRLMRLSSGGLILYVFTVTFSSIDWIMSIDSHWFSSIYGFLIAIGQVLAGFSFAVVVVVLAGRTSLVRMPVNTLHDLGNFLLAAVSLWAYISFSQFLIIWYGNLPEEITWYVPRMAGAWGVVAFLLIVLHFAVPLAVLLSRQSKRQPQIMLTIAPGLLVMHLVDLLWIVVPSFGRDAWWPLGMDLAAVAGIGGVWLFFFTGFLKTHGVGPLGPHAEEPSAHE